MLMVLFDHLCRHYHLDRLGGIVVADVGIFGVLLFFVHTSLVLMYSMQRSGLTGFALMKNFHVRRFFRIYPLSVSRYSLQCTSPPLDRPRHRLWAETWIFGTHFELAPHSESDVLAVSCARSAAERLGVLLEDSCGSLLGHYPDIPHSVARLLSSQLPGLHPAQRLHSRQCHLRSLHCLDRRRLGLGMADVTCCCTFATFPVSGTIILRCVRARASALDSVLVTIVLLPMALYHGLESPAIDWGRDGRRVQHR